MFDIHRFYSLTFFRPLTFSTQSTENYSESELITQQINEQHLLRNAGNNSIFVYL